jgi:Tfp pilus assembly protein PilF
MNNLFRRIQRVGQWLGPARSRIVFVLLAVTGLGSLILNAVVTIMKGDKATTNPAALNSAGWVIGIQSALLLLFVIGTFIVVLSRMRVDERRRAVIIVAPAILAVILSILFPGFWLLFLPVGFGWIFVAYVSSQSRVRREYQGAIKFLRKGEFEPAIDVMTELIKTEPEIADHRRFRAELYRLAGKGYRARDDYQKVIELMPDSGVGYNGLSEVYLQAGDYQTALEYGQKAAELEPDEWVAPYNLGMIEDRLNRSPDALIHLSQAYRVGIPDSRHRLLTHLWLLRAHVRMGDLPRAEAALAAMRRERTGLNEWKIVFESDQSAVLRAVLENDVLLADELIEGTITPAAVLDWQPGITAGVEQSA